MQFVEHPILLCRILYLAYLLQLLVEMVYKLLLLGDVHRYAN